MVWTQNHCEFFNPASQAKKYDPDAEYIREWLPEIRHLDTAALITGDIPESELDGNWLPNADC